MNPWDAPAADLPTKSFESTKVEPPIRVAPPAATYPHQPKYLPPQPITYTVNQDGNIYQAQDLAAVQRWIVENRLTRDGKISTDGQWWDRLGERPEFKSFFEMLDRIQALEARPEPTPVFQNSEPPLLRTTPRNTTPVVPSHEAERPLMVTKQEPILPEAAPHENLEFEPPATEEIPFDRPHTDEQATVASMTAQQSVSEPIFTPKPETPELALPVLEENEVTSGSIYDQYPSFSDTDLPTEEELNITEETDDDHAIAFVDEDWPTEQMGLDDDLEWISAKQQKQRVILGLVFVVLIGITAKTISNMRSEPAPVEVSAPVELDAADSLETVDDGTESAELDPDEAATDENADEVEESEPARAAAPAVREQSPTARATPASTTPAPAVRSSPPPPREPETASSFITTGRESMAEGDYRAARFAFLEAVAIEPQNPQANHGLAFAAHQQNDIPFAMRYYCRALELAQPSSALANDNQSSLDDLHVECEG